MKIGHIITRGPGLVDSATLSSTLAAHQRPARAFSRPALSAGCIQDKSPPCRDHVATPLLMHVLRRARLDFETPPPLCGHYWSGEVMEGLKVLDTLAPDRVLSLRYEDFLETPAESCRKLLEFIQPSTPPVPTGVLNDVDQAWITRATALVGRGRSAWQQLDERPRRELERACKPGMEALERVGLVWT